MKLYPSFTRWVVIVDAWNFLRGAVGFLTGLLKPFCFGMVADCCTAILSAYSFFNGYLLLGIVADLTN